MEDLRGNYPYKYSSESCSSSYSQAAACLPHYHVNIDTNKGIQIQTRTKSLKFVEPGTCNGDDPPAAVIFDSLSAKRPDDYCLLGPASLGLVVQLHQTAEDQSSPAVTQCWKNFVADIVEPAETLTCNSPVYSLLSSGNPLFPPARTRRRKKPAAGGEGRDHEASRECNGNNQLQKQVERQRRNKMKALCLTLISLLPEEYRKTKSTLSDKLLEVIKHIRHLQDKLIDLGKKRDVLKFSATVKPFSNISSDYKKLQDSQARPSIVQDKDKFQTIRVSKFGPGIQVTINTFKNQIDLSSLLMVIEEARVEAVSATFSAINDRVFYSIHSKLSEFRHFDSAVLYERIDQLMNGNLPQNSMIK